MNISEKDRAFLLGTDSFMVQIQRILKQWPDMTMQLAELRSFYPDLSEGRFRSTVYSMQAKGIVKIEDNLISLLKESKVNGEVASKVWNGAAMAESKSPSSRKPSKPPVSVIRAWCIAMICCLERTITLPTPCKPSDFFQ